ncbi:MAG: cell envelope integrity protein CreD [Helicobacteraceae bacterium]|jgi:inner membrane protein|nr:cell envelope integrity protein CreD [Helicobacteraceae bacterium]
MAIKFQKPARFTLKALGVGALILIMWIPLLFVMDMISDRSSYKNEALTKITDAWGGRVFVAPPVLYAPYKVIEIETYSDGRKVAKEGTHYAAYYPTEAIAQIKAATQIRSIGIFKIPVFTADITIEGSFDKISLPKNAEASGAFVEIGVNGLNGTNRFHAFELLFNGEQRAPKVRDTIADEDFECAYNSGCFGSIFASTPIVGDSPHRFKMTATIKGSQSIRVVPAANNNKIRITSDWKDPSFSGNYLPDEKTIDEEGFDATWNIANIVASGPRGPQFITEFLIPVDNYRNAERGVKYGLLFIALTFAAFFAFEVASKRPVHPVQYLLVGVGMVIFYSLLLSFSEFIDFSVSYLIAAAATIALIVSYIKFGIFRDMSVKRVGYAALSFAFLYGFLYILLQLKDMALLYGSIGLFAALAIMMYITRNIGWYEERSDV